MMTPVWPYVGRGVILKILNFLGFPRNFIFCKTGPKVFAYFTGVLSHYWGIIIHQTKPTSSGYQEVKGFWDPSTYSWENGYITILGNFGTHCRTHFFGQLCTIVHFKGRSCPSDSWRRRPQCRTRKVSSWWAGAEKPPFPTISWTECSGTTARATSGRGRGQIQLTKRISGT